jgi:hypothetical protein
MDISNNYFNSLQQRLDAQSRRMRFIENIVEDYQSNMRQVMRLIGYEMAFSYGVTPLFLQNAYGVSPDNHPIPTLHPLSGIVPNVDTIFDGLLGNPNPNPSRASTNTNSYIRSLQNQINQQRNARFIYTQLFESDANARGLTDEQIANETQIVVYDASMNISDRCPISWERFENGQNVIRINRCGHIFKENEITEWLHTHDNCPVCRTSLLQNTTINHTDPSGNTNNNAVNNVLSTILSSVNNAINADNGYYESELTFNVDDLMSIYRRA